nr:protein ROS1-like [Ipomoea trifida]
MNPPHMNLGRQFFMPRENGVVDNGDPWIPVTPQRQISTRPNLIPADMQGNWQERVLTAPHLVPSEIQGNQMNPREPQMPILPGPPGLVPAEMQLGNQMERVNRQEELQRPILPGPNGIPAEMQGNQMEKATNWNDLIGIYEHLLQDSAEVTGKTQNVNSVEKMDNTRAFQNTNSAVPKNLYNRELNHNWNNNLVESRSYSQNIDSYGQNLGHSSPAWNNCNTLAEVFGMRNLQTAHCSNATPDKNTYVTGKPVSSNSCSPLEGGRYRQCNTASPMLQKQAHSMSSSAASDGYNRQYRPHGGFSVLHPTSCKLYTPTPGTVASSSTASFYPLAPITPDKVQQIMMHPLDTVEEFSTPDKDKQERNVGLVLNTPDSSSAAISPLQKECNSVSGGNGDIDLNKTPQLKPQKRRKHRPKVVVEGKPKRKQRAPSTKGSTPKETPSGKRKYVRRKGLKSPSTEQSNIVDEAAASNPENHANSCRRALNFNLGNEVTGESHDRNEVTKVEAQKHTDQSFDLNLDDQNTTVSLGLHKALTASIQHELQNGGQQAETTSNCIYTAPETPLRLSTSSATSKSHTLNAIARNLSMRNPILYQNSSQNGYNQVHQLTPEEGARSQIGFQTRTIQGKTDDTSQSSLQSISQFVRNTANINEKRGCKRDYSQSSEPIALLRSQFLHHKMSQTGQPNFHCSTLEIGSEAHKKRKSEGTLYEIITSMPSCLTSNKGGSTHVQQSSFISHANDRLSNSNLHGTITCKQAENRMNGILSNRHTNPLALGLHYLRQHASHQLHLDTEKQCITSHLHPSKEIVAKHISREGTEVHGRKSLAASSNWNYQYPSLSLSGSLQRHESRISPSMISSSTWEIGRASSNQTSSPKKPPRRKSKNTQSDQQASTKARGLHEEGKYSVTVDILAVRLERMVISDKDVVPNEQNALVPYKGDGALIPFEGYDLTKKRKPRPKVDLDPETSRLWDLLMGKEGSESTQTMDKDKEKWWEEEREVFRGRADSFIARMHLVQGDRRFSKWKGSVVDSVIGVFLTQNVSDHLSSSAFMSLAARFPVKSRSIKETNCQNGVSAWIEEPEIQVIDPDGTITYHQNIIKQPRCGQSSLTSSEASEHVIENLVKGKVHLANEHPRKTEEEVISSQNSSDSFILQANEEIRSSSGSNSEAEDHLSEHSPKNNQSHLLFPQPTELTAPFQKHQNNSMGSPLFETMSSMLEYQQSANPVYNRQNVTVDRHGTTFDYQILSDIQCQQNSATTSGDFWMPMKEYLGSGETTSDSVRKATSLHLTANNVSRAKTSDYSGKSMGHMAGHISTSITQETASPINQPPGLDKNAFINKMSAHQVNLQPDSHSANIKLSTSRDQQETSKIIQLETTITADSNPTEANAKRQSEWQIHSSSKQSTGNDISAANARKRKSEGDRKVVFDWDSLRRQVQSKGERKERSKNTMDSIDYEAIRCAEVKDISDAIRERGMNNMLAERIKDFLNRIVRDHGSIDLEWLRDVPPDKAKEYLLSIRGLGLKSVECVRLLTLHNLAFPVDTNVGRIAVRLGWVPLQPLPESLQLHLLELYPVLETIQKYIWPRLCKLDQKTLYELHYQMITFGKVFCTKSKPNCNACPMRAECRHFASAFASARLALPGPEEKGMVSASLPVSANGNPAAAFKQMPLLPGRSEGVSVVGLPGAVEAGMIPAFLSKPMPQPPQITSVNREVEELITSNCEPIIEEPASPEPLPEVSTSDIEDAFYEDPDEIPTIELNMKEFTTNLQAILQGQNLGMQDGDLSKALITLKPDAASIPTPKLKNISHLRTEHQVYELPDVHPLLEGLDRREPDDPSPYLLAIWTPGETANSIQPPETNCNAQASGRLCNEKTCYSCNSVREADSQTVRGTLLIPCRTATRGSFPLNGTYFQVNEVFADHDSSLNPIDVPRRMIWYLPRRTVYFGTSVSTIFKGLSTEQIQHCFWKGFVCVRGFDQKTRAPRPLMARLHFPASRLVKNKNETRKKDVSAAERIDK